MIAEQTLAAAIPGVISDSESFVNGPPGLGPTSFQAARRLVALGVSAASNSAAATVYSGGDLATLIIAVPGAGGEEARLEKQSKPQEHGEEQK